MLIKLQRHDNYDGGNADFWVTLAKRAMLEHRAIAIDSLTEITLDTKAPARMLLGTKDISNKPHGYLVALILTKRYVYSFEAWGPKDQFAKDRANLEHAIKTLEINP